MNEPGNQDRPAETPATEVRIPVNERLYLSPFAAADKPALIAHLNDREIYDRTLLIPHPYTSAEADSWIEHTRHQTQTQGFCTQFAIRNATGELLGGFGFDTLIVGHKAEIGYWLARRYWGQGIMPAVVAAACRFGFTRWNLVRITAHVYWFNSASARVLEKCGFAYEGLLRKHYRKDGKFIDGRAYALVREES